MWSCGTLKNPLGHKKRKQLTKPIECSDVLVECEQLGRSECEKFHEAAEATEEQAGK